MKFSFISLQQLIENDELIQRQFVNRESSGLQSCILHHISFRFFINWIPKLLTTEKHVVFSYCCVFDGLDFTNNLFLLVFDRKINKPQSEFALREDWVCEAAGRSGLSCEACRGAPWLFPDNLVIYIEYRLLYLVYKITAQFF